VTTIPEVDEFEQLLEFLKSNRGFDFTAYKRTSLRRRVEKRMEEVGVKGFTNYHDYLEVHPDEFGHLFNTILINVTSFFRDPDAWEYLQEQVLPDLVRAHLPDEPLRFWSAGCASGEEAYTLAMVLCEVLGVETFRRRVKIYATDVDEEALNQARLATYSAQAVEAVLPNLRKRYLEKNGNGYSFEKDLRRSVIFGRHDLIQDAPISRISLISCRNTLMYFNAEAQARIIGRFHFALVNGGIMFLGRAETLLSHNASLAPVDLKRRIFRKVQKSEDRLPAGADGRPGAKATNETPMHVVEAAAETAPIPQIAVNAEGELVIANQAARALFGLSARDIGRPLQDLEISYRPAELRSLIERAYQERRPIQQKNVEWSAGPSETLLFDIQVTPLMSSSGERLGAGVAFADVTRFRRMEDELRRSSQELETALEELQSTNEELETTNEELQSTVEELETTNEELHSTNEELETMNEELQSTNDELHSINDQVRQRSDQITELNAFLGSILGGLRSGVIVVDRDLHVQAWNHHAEEMWGLRSAEVQGKHLMNLDFGLPVEKLRADLRACLGGETPQATTSIEAVNRRGRRVMVHVTASPLKNGEETVRGVILLLEEQPPAES
jgi:two-component system CheB/CheR fusion protein